MAARSDATELAVDELRRRARRRLVGAIVLALAAAVLLPLLLESDPKPLGDDVSIQIPPVDSGKFINPLSTAKVPDPKMKGNASTGRNAPQAPVPSPSSDAPPAAKESAVDRETRAAAAPPASAAVAGATSPTDKEAADGKAAATEGKPAAAVPAAGKPGTETMPATQAAPAPAPAPAAAAALESANPGPAYVVQIAAFSDRYGARSLASKLKRGGFPGYTEAVTTEKGTLHRVRVGPYASREAADAALAKLKAAGFNGMVAHVG